MTRVVFRPEAEADLAAIAIFISEHGVERAAAFVQRLRRRCAMLASLPEGGRARPELGSGVRSLVERPYVVLYRIQPEAVEIVAVLHGARDLPTMMRMRIENDDPSS